ncbi:hypothetical protein BCT54_08180 [Vibrio splendidus]|uniref:Uncharacterized protein n=1 Tax=Vibrio splendidus TaxID=29497 RepID=A0A2N7JLY6_VIBSP|nr:hypothetical protein BCT54_08180 [Vibrio splendidus]
MEVQFPLLNAATKLMTSCSGNIARHRFIRPVLFAIFWRVSALKNCFNCFCKEIIVIGFTIDVGSLFGDDYLIINEAFFLSK